MVVFVGLLFLIFNIECKMLRPNYKALGWNFAYVRSRRLLQRRNSVPKCLLFFTSRYLSYSHLSSTVIWFQFLNKDSFGYSVTAWHFSIAEQQ